jgi:hypothetical protein
VDARLATEANGDVLAKYVEDGRLSITQQALPYPAMQQRVGEKCRLAKYFEETDRVRRLADSRDSLIRRCNRRRAKAAMATARR